MAYSVNWGAARGGYNAQQAPFNHRNPNNYRPKAKRSGAKMGTGKNGVDFVQGWNVSRKRGFITLIACPLSDEGVKENRKRFGGEYLSTVMSKTKKVYERWVATIEFRQTGERVTLSAYFLREKAKLYIPRLGMVASCHAPNRGYFGTSKVSKNAGQNR